MQLLKQYSIQYSKDNLIKFSSIHFNQFIIILNNKFIEKNFIFLQLSLIATSIPKQMQSIKLNP